MPIPIHFLGVLIVDHMKPKTTPRAVVLASSPASDGGLSPPGRTPRQIAMEDQGTTGKHAFRQGLTFLILILSATTTRLTAGPPDLAGALPLHQVPRIKPDYAGVTIPPNIAPLN